MTLSAADRREIDDLRADRTLTRRATVPALEEILYEPLPVLDHGFIRVIDYMGDDRAVVQAARVSYGRGTRRVSEDAALIRYLMRHRHSSPFEMCEIKLHVKLPIFVARQWIRHRTANVNEYSARYSILDREFYLPEPDMLAGQSTVNRQGRGEALPTAAAAEVRDRLRATAEAAFDAYDELLVPLAPAPEPTGDGPETDPVGLARELARITLPLSTYTQWYWKIDLHNLFHFLSLRADRHAQYEIRAYAERLLEIIERWVPLCAAAFRDYRRSGVTLSAGGLEVVRRLIAGEPVTAETSGLGRREWRELMAALGRQP